MGKAGAIIATTLFLLFLYIVYTGAVTSMDLILGILGSLIIASFTADLIIRNPSKVVSISRWAYFILYSLLYLTIIEAKAHWGVVKIILHPRMPVNPSIVRVPYDVSSDYAKTTIANSITNTPGTVVVDVDENRKILYVHWIKAVAISDEEARKHISSTFEYYAKRIFD